MDDAETFVFDDVRVDPRAHSVVRNGIEVALEPKAYAVLLVLLEQAGRVVARDDLLDRVWGHRHVTPAVLNRVIAMLRKALGDDADHPRLIRTVYGTGYGFVAPVTRVRMPPRAATVTDIDPSPHPDAKADALATPATPLRPPDEAQAEPVHPAAATRRPMGRIASVVLAIVVVAAGLAWVTGIGRGPSQDDAADHAASLQSPQLTDRDATNTVVARNGSPRELEGPTIRLVVMPFEADADGALTAVADGLTDGLIETLARQPRMAVIARESAEGLRDASPESVLQALDANRLVRGTLRVTAEGELRVDIEMHRAPTGAPWIRSYQRPRGEIFRVLGPLLDDLGSGELPLTTEAGVAELRALPESLQDLYWRAQSVAGQEMRQGDEIAVAARAFSILDEIEQVAPGFALGHALRASVHSYLGVAGRVDLDTAARAATAAADAAIAANPDLAEGHLARGFAATMQWRSIDAMGPAQRALELAPNDYRALALMANVLSYTSRLDQAAALDRRAEALNPLPQWTVSRNRWTHVLAGDRDAALEGIAQINRTLGPNVRAGTATRIHVAFGEYALALAGAGNRKPDESTVITVARASALQLIGEPTLARAQLDAASPLVPAVPSYAALRLRDAVVIGDLAAFRAGLDSDTPLAQSPWRDVFRAAAYAHDGDTRAALREYGRVFAEPRNRELLAYSWFATYSGLSWIADWIALRREAGLPYSAERAAYDALIESMAEGGVRAPAFAYHQAVGAALAGDEAAADRLLGAAIAAGWVDPFALAHDRAWKPYAAADWLARHRREVEGRVAAERAAAGYAAN